MEVRLSRYTIQGQQLFLALVCDITKHQTRERELERTNRLYAILSAVNRTILQSRHARIYSGKSAGSPLST